MFSVRHRSAVINWRFCLTRRPLRPRACKRLLAVKDRACMKALLMPEARMIFVSLGTDGAPTYRIETLDDWIARVKTRGHAQLEEKQLKFRIERYGNIAHLWSSYTLQSDSKQVARGINSIQAIKEAGGWRVTGIMVQAESAAAPLPKEYLP